MQSKMQFTSENIKLLNRLLTLQHIYKSRYDGISQSEVSKKMNISEPSVFRNFTRLEELGLIKIKLEEKPVVLAKGRRPTKYCVVEDYMYTIGAEITTKGVALSLFNFIQDIIDSKTVLIELDKYDADGLTDLIISLCNELLDKNNIPRDKFFGVGLAGPGKIDIENGVILRYERIKGMQDFPIAAKLKEALNCEVRITNYAIAQAHYAQASDPKYGDSVYAIILRHDINASYVKNGKPYVDSKGYTFDMGHLVLAPNGPLCSCGEKGCLQQYIYTIEDEYNPDILMNLEKLLTTDLTRLDYITTKLADYIIVLYKNFGRLLNPDTFLILAKDQAIANIIKTKLDKYFDENVPRFGGDKRKPLFAEEYKVEHSHRAVNELLLTKLFRDPKNKLFTN